MQALHVEAPEPVAMLGILHSNGMSASFYKPLMEELATRGISSVAWDLPGFSGPSPERMGWEGFLDAVRGPVADALEPNGLLLGHSLGGLAAVLLAPELRLRGLVLMEPAVIPWRWLARLGAEVYVRRVFDGPKGFTNRGPWFWRLHDPASFDAKWIAEVDANHAGADRALVGSLHTGLPQLYPLPFARITAPTLVVRGTSSGPVMKLGQRDLVQRIAGAVPVTIEGAGHWLANEQDERIAVAIADFASRLPSARS